MDSARRCDKSGDSVRYRRQFHPMRTVFPSSLRTLQWTEQMRRRRLRGGTDVSLCESKWKMPSLFCKSKSDSLWHQSRSKSCRIRLRLRLQSRSRCCQNQHRTKSKIQIQIRTAIVRICRLTISSLQLCWRRASNVQ